MPDTARVTTHETLGFFPTSNMMVDLWGLYRTESGRPLGPGALGCYMLLRRAVVWGSCETEPKAVRLRQLAERIGIRRQTLTANIRALDSAGVIAFTEPTGRHGGGPQHPAVITLRSWRLPLLRGLRVQGVLAPDQSIPELTDRLTLLWVRDLFRPAAEDLDGKRPALDENRPGTRTESVQARTESVQDPGRKASTNEYTNKTLCKTLEDAPQEEVASDHDAPTEEDLAGVYALVAAGATHRAILDHGLETVRAAKRRFGPPPKPSGPPPPRPAPGPQQIGAYLASAGVDPALVRRAVDVVAAKQGAAK